MNYEVNIEGFEGQDIEVKTSFWSGPKLLINGQLAPKGSKRGEMLLQSNVGKQFVARWKPQIMGIDIPQLVVGDKVINLVEPLKWYQWVWGGLPIALVFVGGALGAIAGITGFAINAKVFRTEMDSVLKYVVSAAVSISAVVAYFIAAMLFTILIHGT
ncbi:hypothetical protein [Thermoflavifilum thermophilum]|uniref:hypothetical protein n=1 Tax=Thermoflavifilum thermophilum TaxID=1393122 RepID=UPI000B855CDA|nr:hypothetical protein [Thermoflavifilum thermophilum]